MVQSDDEEEETEADNHKDNELERRDKEILAWAKKTGEVFSGHFELIASGSTGTCIELIQLWSQVCCHASSGAPGRHSPHTASRTLGQDASECLEGRNN